METNPRSDTLSFSKLSKRFSSQLVLSEITGDFPVSGVIGLFGANGSGKSTFLRILAGLLTQDAGVVNRPNPARIRYLSHESGLYGDLSVRENLLFFRELYGASNRQMEGEIDRWELRTLLSQRVAELSRGQIVRVSLARIFLGECSVYLLDEPTSSLDDRFVEILSDTLTIQAKQALCVIATHDIPRLKAVLTTACVMRSTGITDVLPIEQAISLYREVNR